MAGCAFVLIAAVGPALATSGVSIDLGRIDITEQLSPGGSYNLPTFGVRNPGTERTSYTIVANPVLDPARKAPPAAWFRFDPATVTLDPGATQPVHVRLVVPTDAAPGDYIVLVGAQIASQGSGATVGAAAAARTTFTVAPANAIDAALTWLGQTFSDLLPWSAIVPGVAVVLLAVWLLRRRFSFGLTVQRREP
jgi:hypothetical protein